MLGYITVGVRDIDRAVKFYDELFSILGMKMLVDKPKMKFYGISKSSGMFGICSPHNGETQHPGNGTMAAFWAGSKDSAAALYHKALELGASDEGAPGERNSIYGAYVRDLDGNKLCFYCWI